MKPMMIRSALALVAMVAVATPAAAQGGRAIGDAAYDSAFFAWEAGNYPQALTRLQRLITGPNAERYRTPAALLTGELYATTELTRDGRNARISPNGRYVAYDVGLGAAAKTHVVEVQNGGFRDLGMLPGSGAVLGEASVAYIQTPAGGSRANAELVIRDLKTNAEQKYPGLQPQTLYYRADGSLLFLAADSGAAQVFILRNGQANRLTDVAGAKREPVLLPSGELYYTRDNTTIIRAHVVDISDSNGNVYRPLNPETKITGTGFTVSADGSRVAYVVRDGSRSKLIVAGEDGRPLLELDRPYQMQSPRVSPDGSRVVFQAMPREDWDIYVAEIGTTATSGATERRLTTDIQHDLTPQFLDNDHVLGLIGEARHRRSYIYDLRTGERTRVFHNNTIRTVAPEYEWVPSADGKSIAIVAERDGDTVSPERGVYVVDLTKQVSAPDVAARVRAMQVSENDLRARGRTMFAPIATTVTAVTQDVSKDRIYSYAADLYSFGSKYITQPGNAKAIEYIAGKLRSWGYDPEIQYFEATPRGSSTPVRTANVIARLRGTMDADATYVASSHFDSVVAGNGADDDSSGTTALLEAARVMAKRPQARTIEFAFFTGEEAGLLGSREFVRQAVAGGKKIVGALNNDMIGFANDQRLDNTIRYSNDGIRDLQHGAALGFSNLITYDAKYYKSTDAHAYYEAYGDIVGGIGSYPILGNPHYHQSHDVLETINQQLVAEVSKTTVATLMLLAASPSRLSGIDAKRGVAGVSVTWKPVAESDIKSFEVEWGTAGQPARGTAVINTGSATSYANPGIRAGDEVRVRAINTKGMKAWDWAKVIAP